MGFEDRSRRSCDPERFTASPGSRSRERSERFERSGLPDGRGTYPVLNHPSHGMQTLIFHTPLNL